MANDASPHPGKRSAEQRLGLAVNIAILCVCVLICAVLTKRFLLSPLAPSPQRASAPAVGSRLTLPGERWGSETLVMAVSTTCHYCSSSAPFYQRLLPAASAHHVKVVAVLPQPHEEATAYLTHLGLPAGLEAVQAPLSTIDVNGTPTLLLVDGSGVVQKSWVGQLPSAQEQDVLAHLGKAAEPAKAL